MGRPKLAAGKKRSAQRTLKLTAAELRQLEELAELPNPDLSALFRVAVGDAAMNQRFKEKNSVSNVIRSLIFHAHRRLEKARDEGLPWALTGRSLSLVAGGDLLGIGEERLRGYFKTLRVEGRKANAGYGRYSRAEVEYARAYMAAQERSRAGEDQEGAERQRLEQKSQRAKNVRARR